MRSWQVSLLVCHFLVVISKIQAYATISDNTLRNSLVRPQASDFDIQTGPLLAPILIPRVPGTPGSLKVLNHFIDFFRNSLPEWTITFQNSTSRTPTHGDQEVPFVNFIATRDPPWAKEGNVGRLDLVAHYDSKYQPTGFIGATDSAAPCAIIMHAVRSIDTALARKWQQMQADGYDPDLEDDYTKGIQVLFLDGEEAFASWTDIDSIYGARSLAEEWDNTVHPAMSTYKTKLNSIELFMLLDLLGSAENPAIQSWMQSTHWSYQQLATLEQRLRSLGLFKSDSSKTWLPDKDKKNDAHFNSYMMQDDHIPFAARGVPILHLIPGRFPSVWHTMNDDGKHLDIPTIEDWSLLLSAFVAEYLELDGYFEPRAMSERQTAGMKRKDEL